MFYSILFNWSNQYVFNDACIIYYFCHYLISSVNIFKYTNEEIKHTIETLEEIIEELISRNCVNK